MTGLPRELFCTYCSARKRTDPKMLPAVRRYDSPRIRSVHRESRRESAGFAILSGKYGLVGPYRKIAYYDHLLRDGEIPMLLPQMAEFLRKKRCRSVRFFHESARRFPRLKPYLRAIRAACRKAGVGLRMERIASGRYPGRASRG